MIQFGLNRLGRIACFLALCLPATAAQVIITITGVTSDGLDITGVFGPPNTLLAGQTFTLVFTVDDKKGAPSQALCPGNIPYVTSIESTPTSNPATATLTIHDHSFTFGVLNAAEAVQSEVQRYAPTPTCGAGSSMFFLAGDGHYENGSGLNGYVYPATGTVLTPDPNWESSFTDSNLYVSPVGAGSLQYEISEYGTTGQAVSSGGLIPQTIRVYGPDSPCSTWPITPYTDSILGRPYMLASFTPPNGLTLPNFADSCGFNHFNWQQQITTDPGGGAGTTVQPVLPTPLISSGNVIYQSSANSQPIPVTPASGLCVSNWIGCSLVAPPPYFDPPDGGYVGMGMWNPYPFYFPDQPGGLPAPRCASGEVCPYPYPDVVNSSNTTFTFQDGPGRTSFRGVPPATNPPAGQFLAFKTAFVGVVGAGVTRKIYPLFSWTWNTTFNGETCLSYFSCGTGGITITSINGVQLPTVIPDEQVATAASGLAFSRVTQTFNGTITLTNISSASLNGPFQLLLTGLPADVTLANATGNLSGTPYLTVPNLGTLAPNQSITVGVQFKNPFNAVINLTPAIYSGSIN